MSDNDEDKDVQDLEIFGIIAFDGDTVNGLQLHPDNEHIIFPIGNKVSILHWPTKKQTFLAGHTNIISSLTVSKCGKYIASGQINHIGFRASLIIWDWETRTQIVKHEIHKVRVEAITFSCDSRFVISLGGRDCGMCVVYDIANRSPLSGTKASPDSAGETSTIYATNLRGPCFVTAGINTIRVWTIDEDARALRTVDVNVFKIKRSILSIAIDYRDEFAYCGTSTGDLLKIMLNFDYDLKNLLPTKKPGMCGCYAKICKNKSRGRKTDSTTVCYSKGIRVLYLFLDGRLLIGAGDGEVDLVRECETHECGQYKASSNILQPTQPKLISLQKTNIGGTVTSIIMKDSNTIFASTTNSEIYSINMNNFNDVKLLVTCHTGPIYDVAFPNKFSEVFATASKQDVRIWSLISKQELLRIKVPNFSCSSVRFSYNGKIILTGWDDGIIRGFTPITGKLMFAILNAHNKGVSALAITSDDAKIISGGCEGQVRVWSLTPQKQELIHVLKEHKGPITAIDINKYNTEAVSSSSDGACIIWDIVRLCRKQIYIRNTLFMCVKYYPTGVQILTGGSDRKIAYWEVFDGSLVRELEGSISAAINSLDISNDGELFITGGNDQILKLWKYNEGYTTHIGLGHSGVITAVKFSPNGEYIVSASGSGDIFIWLSPYKLKLATKENGSGDKNVTNGKQKQISSNKERNTNSQKGSEEIQNIEANPGDKESIKVELEDTNHSESARKNDVKNETNVSKCNCRCTCNTLNNK